MPPCRAFSIAIWLRRQKSPKADAALENLRRDWDARQTWLHIVIEHGEINEAESLLRRCLVLCMAQERTDLRADLAALRSQMVLLNEMERVSVKNIL